jgi:hypothetical protein
MGLESWKRACLRAVGDRELLHSLSRDIGYTLTSHDDEFHRQLRNHIADLCESITDDFSRGMMLALVEVIDGHRLRMKGKV